MSTSIDPEDLLSDSLEVFYDYTPITHSSAGSIFTYTTCITSGIDESSRRQDSPPVSLRITLETPDVQAANWSLHASSIWMSSIYVADHIEDLRIPQYIEHAHRRGELPIHMLELGAGAGLPSILISKCFGDDVKVVASDYPDESLIQTLHKNIDVNEVTEQCHAIPYAWGTDAAQLLRHTPRWKSQEIGTADIGYDLVIAADTLWNPDLHTLFLLTLQSVLRKSDTARIHIVAGLHTGRYTLQSFMNRLPEYGLEIEDLEEREAKGSHRRGWSLGHAEGEEDRERRKWVVWMSIKWGKI